MLSELIATCAQDASKEERIAKISKTQEKLCEINELAIKVEGSMKMKKQEKKQEEIAKEHREMTKGHVDAQEESNIKLQRLNHEMNELRHLNKTYEARHRQQQEQKKKVKRCK